MDLRSGRVLSSSNSCATMPDPETTVNQVVMTPEMFQTLLDSMRLTTPPTQNQNGNFSQCTARFSGDASDNVEAFIDSITVYKECVNISEENALKGLSMLLHDNAATWWQGIKSSVMTFRDALRALRHAYGYAKPAYQIYRELFSQEQSHDENTDIFISKARALLAHLPAEPAVHETTQLDMVYGLLHHRIRERVPRDRIKTFMELIEATRVVEQTLFHKKNSNPVQANKKKLQCTYCKNYGHSKDECRKAAKSRQEVKESTPKEEPATKLPEIKHLACYGCGKVGYVRGNCPNCKAQASATTSTLSSEFFYQSFAKDQQIRPVVEIDINNSHGLAFIDTGAKSSVAGATLRKLLLQRHVPYEARTMLMTLADGKERLVEAFIFKVDVVLKHKVVPISLISVAEHENSRTLLGIDFIKAAKMLLDITSNEWAFKESPDITYPFIQEVEYKLHAAINTVDFTELHLREDEGTSLDSEQRNQFNLLLSKNHILFSPNIEATPFAEHTIKLLDDVPTSVPPYRMPDTKKKILRQELDQLLDNGIIEECESPYAAPVVLVPKKDGGVRLCVDYQRLNAITQADKYPLPRLDDLLHSAKRTKYMTTLDLKSGYHQVAVRPSDKDKTTFITPFGTFRYNRMPFGLKNAPATFQRLIDRYRSGLQDIVILAYLDDIIILSPTYENHLKDLQRVFDRLRLFKLHLNRTKCTFACISVRYLGHVITTRGIQPDPGKVSAILDMRPPQNVKQVLTFLQTCSWFRRFMENFAEISRPLSSLTKKNAKWQWGDKQEKAFNMLKQLLTSSPILRQADSRLPYILKTDASSYALGAVLLQGEGPDERPIEYASRLLTPAERNYHTTEREALAVIWAVDKYRGYIENATIVVQSDHQPLKWLLSLKSPSGRLARWALSLQSYDIRIEYTPGRTNVVADTLSRPPLDETEVKIVTIELPSYNASELRCQQLMDPDIQKIIECFESPLPNNLEYKKWTERGYLMNNGVLYRFSPESEEEEAQQVVPKAQITRILQENHDSPLSGHYGVERTIQRINKRYYWPGMRRHITEHVSRCLECQKFKPSNLKPAGLLQTPIQSQRFEILSIDLFGPLPETPTGDRWIFIIEDVASRWTEIFPLIAATAEACARCLIDEVILRFGVPRKVISDNGVQFVSSVMQQVAYCLGFSQNLVPVYHPESNPVERKNRDLKTQLAILAHTDHTSWKDKLPSIRFSINTARCHSTGYSPAYLTFGRDLRTPDDVHRDLRAIVENDNFIPQITPYLRTMGQVLREARENHERNQDKTKAYADEHRREVTYQVGDKVLVDVHALSKAKSSYTSKFAPRRDGPYIIIKVHSPTSYEVANLNQPTIPLGKYHVSALTNYRGLDGESPIRPLRKRGRPAATPNEEALKPIQDNGQNSEALMPDQTELEAQARRSQRNASAPKCHCCTHT